MAVLTSPMSPLPTLFQTAPFLARCDAKPSRSTVLPQEQETGDQTDFPFSRPKQASSSTNLGPSLLSKNMTIQLESDPERRLMRVPQEDKTTAVFAELPATGKFMWEHALLVQLLLC